MLGRRRRAREEFLGWAAECAIPLDPRDPASEPERLAPLDAPLDGKRLAFLGESNHFVHEKYAYRLLFLRYLHSRGWRHAGEELAWSDGRRVDRYLETGDPGQLERVATCGHRAGERADRDDRPTGVLAEGWDDGSEALAAEQIRFARALRSMGEGAERWHLFGFDVDYYPWLAYEDLDAWLGAGPDDPPLRELRERLARVPGETLDEEVARLGAAARRAAELLPALEARCGPALAADIVRSARTLHASHAYVRGAHRARSWAELREPMAARERLMVEHVDHALGVLGPDERVVLMAHDQHLARDDAGIRGPPGGVGPGGGIVASLGSTLARREPERVFSVWMLEERGEHSGALHSLGNRLESVPGTLNALLGEVGPAFVLPTASSDPRARLLASPQDVVTLYGSRIRVVPAAQTDAICFIRDVGPLRT